MTTGKRFIVGIVFLTIAILVGGIFFLSSNSNPPSPANVGNNSSNNSISESKIITRNGMHWHPKVTIYIKGEKQSLPNGIGLNGSAHNPIHTHDDADQDIVHMEFQRVVTKEETKLGNFFEIWGKEFSSTQIFDRKNSPEGSVKMMVNGNNNTEFENYKMRDGDQIEINYE
jgi:hypothetical protein